MLKLETNLVLKRLFNFIEVICFLAIILFFSFQSDWFKTKLCKAYINVSTSGLEGSISLGYIHFYENEIIIDNLIISDKFTDTILYIPTTALTISQFDILSKNIKIKSISLEDPILCISKFNASKGYNFNSLIEHFKPEESSPFLLVIENIKLNNGIFKFNNYDHNLLIHSQIVFKNLNTEIASLSSNSDHTFFRVNSLNFESRKGLILKDLDAKINLLENELLIGDLHIKSQESLISLELLQYSFSDSIIIKIAESSISTNDINRLYSGSMEANSNFQISGIIQGPISDLSLNELTLKPIQ